MEKGKEEKKTDKTEIKNSDSAHSGLYISKTPAYKVALIITYLGQKNILVILIKSGTG